MNAEQIAETINQVLELSADLLTKDQSDKLQNDLVRGAEVYFRNQASRKVQKVVDLTNK